MTFTNPWLGDIPSGGEHRGDVTATIHGDGQVTLAWPDDANCTIVGRGILESIVNERNRLVREGREHEQRAELLRRQIKDARNDREEDEAQIRDLIAQLDRHRTDAAQRGAELDRVRGLLDLRDGELAHANEQRDQARREVESLRATVRGLTSQTQAYVDRAEAEGARIIELAGEVERLRNIVPVLVGNAIDAGASNDGEAIARLNATAAAAIEPGVLVNPEAERLRGLLAEALDGWQYVATTADHGDRDIARIAELRREAGST